MAGSLANPWTFEQPAVLDALRDAAIVDLQLVYDSSNYVYVARLQHQEHGAGLGIYKPARGERPLSDFPYGTLHQREVAAWELSQLLGWRLVPPTVERDGPQGRGSMQLVIDHHPREHYFVTREREDLHEQFVRVAVFDLVANNADRKGGHLLLDASNHVWGIDNGLCFHAYEKLRTVVWDFAGVSIPEALIEDLRRVRACLDAEDESVAALARRMSERERVALGARIDGLLAHPVLPEMYPWRCTPWPLV